MKLYDYFRSTASYRVRIALHLKGLSYEKFQVHLVNQGGEQHFETYKTVNPQALVPCLETVEGNLGQSLAIIEYLDSVYPNPPLLPASEWDKAQVRSIALTIACDIHPLNNLRVLNQLRSQFKAKDEEITTWYHHWLRLGFEALEDKLQRLPRIEPVCFGDQVTMADLCLVPQVYNATRFEFDMTDFPLTREINDHCLSLKAFQEARPE